MAQAVCIIDPVQSSKGESLEIITASQGIQSHAHIYIYKMLAHSGYKHTKQVYMILLLIYKTTFHSA